MTPELSAQIAATLTTQFQACLSELDPFDQFNCIEFMRNWLQEQTPAAARTAFASLFPRIKKIEWSIEHEYDDMGSTFAYVENITYVRTDGVSITLRNFNDEEDQYVMETHIPEGLDLKDADVNGLQELATLFDEELTVVGEDEDTREATLRLFAGFSGFSGGDHEALGIALCTVWDSAYYTYNDTRMTDYELR